MWLMTRLAIILYVIIIWVTSIATILIVTHVIDFETIHHILQLVYDDQKIRIIVFAIAFGIFLIQWHYNKRRDLDPTDLIFLVSTILLTDSYWNFKDIKSTLEDNNILYLGDEPYRWKWFDKRHYLFDKNSR